MQQQQPYMLVSQSPLLQMSDIDIAAARERLLSTLRTDIIPSKREIVSSLHRFINSKNGVQLGMTLCERVFYRREYDVKPRDFNSWQPGRKQTYNTQRRIYMTRFHNVLPTARFDDLLEHEMQELQQYYRYAQMWIDMVQDGTRDCEVAFGTPHPTKPLHGNDLDFEMLPPLRSMYDVELERRRKLQEPAVSSTSYCTQCETGEYIIDTHIVGDLVCSNCGMVIANINVDETLSGTGHPFGTEVFATNNRGCYEMTENFMKNLDLLEGSSTNKVTDEAKQFVKDNVNGRRVSIQLIRRILKQGGFQRFYPESSVIYEFATDTIIEKCTKDERAQIHRMHIQYVYAFLECPESIKRRKSSLTNNYLTCKFYQMLGLQHRIRFLRMLKCPKKIREHDRVFAWIVDYVRNNSEARRVANGTSYWAWYLTPQD